MTNREKFKKTWGGPLALKTKNTFRPSHASHLGTGKVQLRLLDGQDAVKMQLPFAKYFQALSTSGWQNSRKFDNFVKTEWECSRIWPREIYDIRR